METLHKTFITPIDREEIHQLISGMDDILDFMDAASQRVVLYEITTVTVEAQELAQVLLQATEQVQEAVRGLRRLQYPMETLQTCVEINRLENEGDAALRRGMARLFKESTDPIHIIKWKEIYESLKKRPMPARMSPTSSQVSSSSTASMSATEDILGIVQLWHAPLIVRRRSSLRALVRALYWVERSDRAMVSQ